ncbi:MAG: response regulator [Thermoflexales bacterium]|nr:response regulator [Thermoflexales bacterium]
MPADKKILIVDDDMESLKLIGLMLERRGYQILAAQDGGQALDKIRANMPDLIILDVMMPGVDGIEVCRRLRANPDTAHIPIVMFTAKTTINDKVAGFQAGADDYLTKPIHPAELASRVEAILLRASHAAPSETPPASQAQIISFLGCKGGLGTSTLALNVAVALSQAKAGEQAPRVILGELMTGAGVIGLHIGVSRELGISALLSKRVDEITTHAIEAQLITHSSGLKLLLAPQTPRSRGLPPDHVRTIVRRLAAQADIVVLDLGTGLDEGVRAALLLSHSTVVVIESQRAALALAEKLLQRLEAVGLPHSNVGLALVNRVPSAASLTRSTIEEMLQSTLLAVVPPAPELAFQATESSIPLIIMQPHSLVSTQILELVRALSKR